MPVTPETFANNVSTTVAGGAGGAGSTLVATDATLLLPSGVGAELPSAGPCRLLFGDLTTTYEIATYASRSGDTLSGLVRGLEGTTALTWAFGTPVQQVTTAQSLTSLWSTVKDLPYRPELYGAVGDGTTDDGPAFRLMAAAMTAAGASKVRLGAKTYTIKTVVASTDGLLHAGCFLPPNAEVEGDGAGVTVVKLSGVDSRTVDGSVGTTVFWVDGATGNDSNPGTRSQPWATVAHAAAQTLAAGTTVLVKSANYTGAFTISSSGTALAPIRFISLVPRGAKITGPGLGNLSQVVTLAGDYVQFIGFEVTAPNDQIGVFATGTHDRVAGCYVHDVCAINASASGGAGIDFSTGGGSFGTPNFGVCDGNLVLHIGGGQASTFTNAAFVHGIYPTSPSVTVTNNIVGDCSGFGVHCFHNPDLNVVANNTIFNCGSSTNSGGAIQIAEDTGFTIHNCIVNNNICYGCWTGLWESGSGSASGNTYTNNAIFNCTTATNITQGGVVSGTITSDPQLVTYASDGTGDYRLRSTSPCIGAGVTASMPSTDYEGLTRPGLTSANPSVGAYEYLAVGYPAPAIFANADASGDTSITLRGLTLDGGAAAATGMTTGAILRSVRRVRLRDVAIRNMFGTIAPGGGVSDPGGVQIDQCADVLVSGVQAYTSDGAPVMSTGLAVRYARNVTLDGYTAQGLTTGHGAQLKACASVRAVGCDCYSNGGDGLRLAQVSNYHIESCDLGGTNAPVANAAGAANATLGNTGNGLSILRSSGIGHVKGCLSANNGGLGISADASCSLLTVAACQVNNNSGGGINHAAANLRLTPDTKASGNSGFDVQMGGTRFFPSGIQTTPTVPATTVAFTNPYPLAMTVILTGGTISAISVNGSSTTLTTTPATVRVPLGGTITLTYTSAPSWRWFSD